MSHKLSSQQCISPADITIPGLPHASYKIFAAASARYYHAPLGPDTPHWEYSNRGILVFGKNISAFGTASLFDDAYWFRLLVAKSGELKTTWVFNIPTDLNYQIDKPFFHVIQGLTRRYGFLFDHDDAGATFADQVRAHHVTPAPDKRSLRKSKSISRRSVGLRSKSQPARISSKDCSTITIASPATGSFRHIMHIGFNRLGVPEATNAKAPDPAWKVMVGTFYDSSRTARSQTSASSETSEDGEENPGQLPDTVAMGCAVL
ncbi:hypothetical protein AX15_000301 [Amanita polypyramis BW_CC]|nr:hypothetical protein AX15_000301 [Amanita polypyramis BW_CC]